MPGARPSQEQLLDWMQSLSNWGRWGEDDQRGTLNLLSPDKTKRALAAVPYTDGEHAGGPRECEGEPHAACDVSGAAAQRQDRPFGDR